MIHPFPHATRRAAALALVAGAAHVAGCSAFAPAGPAPVAELAPTGTLRAAINFCNPILAAKDGAGQPSGVSVDLARELGRRLGLPVELVPFTAAGRVVEAVRDAKVDIAFVAIDPVRGADMLQTPPYVIIEGAYLVKGDSPIRRNEEVDRPGNRIVVGNGSADDLDLNRELKAAKLVKAPTSPAVTDMFLAQGVEVAMGLPRGRDNGARYVSAFVEEVKASGFVEAALRRHRIEGALVAAAGAAR